MDGRRLRPSKAKTFHGKKSNMVLVKREILVFIGQILLVELGIGTGKLQAEMLT